VVELLLFPGAHDARTFRIPPDRDKLYLNHGEHGGHGEGNLEAMKLRKEWSLRFGRQEGRNVSE